LTALAVAYQVEALMTASAPFMERGFDLTTQLTYSLGAGVAKALALDEAKTAVQPRGVRLPRISDPTIHLGGEQHKVRQAGNGPCGCAIEPGHQGRRAIT